MGEEELPAAQPVEQGWGAGEPAHEAVGDAEHGKDGGHGVADQGRVEVLQVARAGDNQNDQRDGHEQRDNGRTAVIAGRHGSPLLIGAYGLPLAPFALEGS